MEFILAWLAKKGITGFFKGVRDWFSDLPQWLKIGAVILIALLLWTWWVNDHAYDRGDSYRKGLDAKTIADLTASNTALLAGIDAANAATEAARAEGARQAKEAAEAGRKAVADMEAARRREKTRGPGAKAMTEFLQETFQ